MRTGLSNGSIVISSKKAPSLLTRDSSASEESMLVGDIGCIVRVRSDGPFVLRVSRLQVEAGESAP
jgi:hypothetical protein